MVVVQAPTRRDEAFSALGGWMLVLLVTDVTSSHPTYNTLYPWKGKEKRSVSYPMVDGTRTEPIHDAGTWEEHWPTRILQGSM